MNPISMHNVYIFYHSYILAGYCIQFAAKKLDRRLQNIGGKPLIQKGLGDDQHQSGYAVGLILSCFNLYLDVHFVSLLYLISYLYDFLEMFVKFSTIPILYDSVF